MRLLACFGPDSANEISVAFDECINCEEFVDRSGPLQLLI